MAKAMAASMRAEIPAVKLLYTPREATEVIACSMSTLYELMLRGEIASVKQGRSRRITRSALEAYVRRLEGGDGPQRAA